MSSTTEPITGVFYKYSVIKHSTEQITILLEGVLEQRLKAHKSDLIFMGTRKCVANLMEIYPVPQMPTSWHPLEEKTGDHQRSGTIHPLRTENIWTKFHGAVHPVVVEIFYVRTSVVHCFQGHADKAKNWPGKNFKPESNYKNNISLTFCQCWL